MLTKSIGAALLSTALLTTAAFAQSSSSSTTTTPAATSSTSTMAANPASMQGNWRTSKVVGLNVYNDNNESLGSISDLLTDKSGKIVAAVVGVGGFLGVGERLVAVPWDRIKFVNEPIRTSAATAPGGANPATGGPTAATSTTTTTTSDAGRPAPTATTTDTTRPATSSTTGMSTGGPLGSPANSTAASTPNPWYPDHAILSTTKDELKAMAEFKYST